MDFSNRSTQPQPVAPSSHVATASAAGGKRSRAEKGKWYQVGFLTLVAVVVVLLIALAVFFAGNNGDNEDSYVNTGKLQAVFLQTGQVYFGNIKVLNDKYAVLTNIYYLQTSNNGSSSSTTSSSSNTNVSLVKLGCELHMPYDQMVINQNQITFWENLQSDGQVAKAVATFQKENPNGQKCADQSTSSGNTSSSVQSAGTSSSKP